MAQVQLVVQVAVVQVTLLVLVQSVVQEQQIKDLQVALVLQMHQLIPQVVAEAVLVRWALMRVSK